MLISRLYKLEIGNLVSLVILINLLFGYLGILDWSIVMKFIR